MFNAKDMLKVSKQRISNVFGAKLLLVDSISTSSSAEKKSKRVTMSVCCSTYIHHMVIGKKNTLYPDSDLGLYLFNLYLAQVCNTLSRTSL